MRFRPNPRAEQGIRRQPEFKADMAERTRLVAATIRFVALPFRNTGYFIQHIEVRGNRVLFQDVFWFLSEFGSVHNPPQRNALRGVRAAGLRFEDHGVSDAE
jgi:hypothetical protein